MTHLPAATVLPMILPAFCLALLCTLVPGTSLASAEPAAVPTASCTTATDCSLNGVCVDSSSTCTCDPPWTGPRCGILAFSAASPAAGRSLYNSEDVLHNTWNGPMVQDAATGQVRRLPPLLCSSTRDPQHRTQGTGTTRCMRASVPHIPLCHLVRRCCIPHAPEALSARSPRSTSTRSPRAPLRHPIRYTRRATPSSLTPLPPFPLPSPRSQYHMYVPLYPAGELYHPVSLLHGTAATRLGPWTWSNLTGVPVSINPGALVYEDAATVSLTPPYQPCLPASI